MRTIILLLASVASLSAAYPNGYTYRRTLTVQAGKVPSSQVFFPFLFEGTYDGTSGTADLRTIANGGKVNGTCTQAGISITVGCDVAFSSDSDGLIPLSFHWESYSATTGAVVGWVKVPSIATGAIVYLFYGNLAVTTFAGSVSGTWDTNYKGVFHLRDSAASTTVIDATGTGNGAAGRNTSLTVSASGEIDGAQTYNGTSDYFSIASSALSTGSNFTVSMWYNRVASPGSDNKRLFALLTDANNHFQLVTDETSGRYAVQLTRSGVSVLSGVTYSFYTTGSLVYLVYTVSGSTGTFYVNGSPVSSVGSVSVASGASYGYNIGRRPDANSTTYLKGVIDEVRLSSSARSANWISAEWANQSDPASFYTVGPETTNPGSKHALMMQ